MNKSVTRVCCAEIDDSSLCRGLRQLDANDFLSVWIYSASDSDYSLYQNSAGFSVVELRYAFAPRTHTSIAMSNSCMLNHLRSHVQ